jgi:hypothetical protein
VEHTQFSLSDLLATNGPVSKDSRFVILKSYFDGGNQADSREYDVVSLAVVSGTFEEWGPFEADWNRVLTDHRADHLHTTYAVSRQGIYKDWSEDQADDFLSDCSRVARKHCARATIDGIPGKFGLHIFVISIVLKDFVEEAKRNPFASSNANESCLRQAMGEVLMWSDDQAACKDCHFFFDQGEPFYGHLAQLLENKRATTSAFLLKKITHRTQSDMRRVPALQLADLYAWAQCHRNDPWNPTWKQKLLRSHFRWQWMDRTNMESIDVNQQAEWLRWKMPKRAATK